MPWGVRETELSTVEKGNVGNLLYMILFQTLKYITLHFTFYIYKNYFQRKYVPLSLVRSLNGENGVHLQKEEKN